jgi:hypothetical protein
MPVTVDLGRLQLLETDSNIFLSCNIVLCLENPSRLLPLGLDLQTLRTFWMRRGEGMCVTLEAPPHHRQPHLGHMARILCGSEVRMPSHRRLSDSCRSGQSLSCGRLCGLPTTMVKTLGPLFWTL